MKFPLTGLLAGLFLVTSVMLITRGQAVAADPLPVIIDTDFGADIDDAFALGLAFVSPELEVVAITTVGGGNEFDPYVGQRKDRDDHRAWMVTRFLTQSKYVPSPPKDKSEQRTPAAFNQSILQGAKAIPVAAGAEPQPKMPIGNMIQYRRHPAAIYNRTLKPVKESAVELMTSVLKDREVTIIALGPLTNIARLIKEQPEVANRIKRIVVMGGAVKHGYGVNPEPEVEWNIKCDIPAAQTVFQAKIPLLVVPLDATAMVELKEKQRSEFFAAHTPLTWQIQNLYELWTNQNKDPVLFDPVAIAAAFHPKHLTIQELPLQVSDDGLTVEKAGAPKIPVAMKIDSQAFLDWYVARVKAAGKESLPEPPKNFSKMVEPGKFPARVHAFEDFMYDIEERWVMCGKVLRRFANDPHDRYCEAVLTQDFDDRQGQTQTMYRAVIFNPVPGPPMGPNTRLKFRYKLIGTDMLRVQLYSLTNGYHRYLSLTGLEQGKWLDGCVDMTQMRRPDGTGGPLAENERIDDIQFYVDPRATVLIDDIVLYDAAAKNEVRPFPQRIIFTAWFDSGKQGKEWPGTFDIVDHAKPRQWKFAQSMKVGEEGKSVLNISLRGMRDFDPDAELTMQMRTSQTKNNILLEFGQFGRATPMAKQFRLETADEWQSVKLKLDFTSAVTDELRFTGFDTVFAIDDLLFYEP